MYSGQSVNYVNNKFRFRQDKNSLFFTQYLREMPTPSPAVKYAGNPELSKNTKGIFQIFLVSHSVMFRFILLFKLLKVNKIKADP